MGEGVVREMEKELGVVLEASDAQSHKAGLGVFSFSLQIGLNLGTRRLAVSVQPHRGPEISSWNLGTPQEHIQPWSP